KTKYEEAEGTLSDKSSEHDDIKNGTLPSEESIIEKTESAPTINYILSNDISKLRETHDEDIDSYQPLYRSLVDTLEEVSVEYDESDADSIYDSRNNKQLLNSIDTSIDSDESDATDNVNYVLEDMSSDFEGFETQTHKHYVPLCIKQTPSTYEATKMAFTISLLIHLEHILNNLALMPKMYFGTGVITNEKQEFWYGKLW
ncbi:17065_t:CDS:2, partial [Racocetra persica]